MIDWVMRAEGSVPARGGAVARGPAARPGHRRRRRRVVRRRVRWPRRWSGRRDDAQLLAQVVDFYHRALLDSPDALGWLARRRIDDPEAIAGFRLGLANRSLGLRLPDRATAAGAELRGRLAGSGCCGRRGTSISTGRSSFRCSTSTATVVDLYGRKVRDDLRAGTPAHLYLPGPHRGVFNVAALPGCAGEVVLCESLIDALTFWCAGHRNVTASFGTGGFTEAHRAAFTAAGVGRVLIAYDNDDAGQHRRAAAGRFPCRGRGRVPAGVLPAGRGRQRRRGHRRRSGAGVGPAAAGRAVDGPRRRPAAPHRLPTRLPARRRGCRDACRPDRGADPRLRQILRPPRSRTIRHCPGRSTGSRRAPTVIRRVSGGR